MNLDLMAQADTLFGELGSWATTDEVVLVVNDVFQFSPLLVGRRAGDISELQIIYFNSRLFSWGDKIRRKVGLPE